MKRYQKNMFVEESKLNFDQYEGYKGLWEPIFSECIKKKSLVSSQISMKRNMSLDFAIHGMEK